MKIDYPSHTPMEIDSPCPEQPTDRDEIQRLQTLLCQKQEQAITDGVYSNGEISNLKQTLYSKINAYKESKTGYVSKLPQPDDFVPFSPTKDQYNILLEQYWTEKDTHDIELQIKEREIDSCKKELMNTQNELRKYKLCYKQIKDLVEGMNECPL